MSVTISNEEYEYLQHCRATAEFLPCYIQQRTISSGSAERKSMITVTETKELYTYSELTVPAQFTAINQLVNAWIDMPPLVPEDAQEAYDKAGRDAERMQTPWFFGEYIYDYCREQIMRELNEGYFTKDGEFYKQIEE